MKIRKPFFAILILLVLSLILGFLIITLNASEMLQQVEFRNNLKTKNMTWSLKVIEAEVNKVYDSMKEKTNAWVKLMASSLQTYVNGKTYSGKRIFDDGVIVQLRGGKILYPAGFDFYFDGLDAEILESEPTLELLTKVSTDRLIQQDYAATVKKITDDFWYIHMTPFLEYNKMKNEQNDIFSMIDFLQKAFDGYLFLFESRDPDKAAYYVPPEFSDVQTAADLGITEEMLESRSMVIPIDSVSHFASVTSLKLFKTPLTAVFLVSSDKLSGSLENNMIWVLALTLVAEIAVILWLYWVQTHVRDNELTEREKTDYHPSHIRKKVRMIGILCGIGIIFIAGAVDLLGTLSIESESNRQMVALADDRMEASDGIVSRYRSNIEAWTGYYAQHLAALLMDHPDFQTQEFLAEAARNLKLEYAVFFDENGKEICSSNGLIDLDLTGNFPNSDSLKKLLWGVPEVFCEPAPDLTNGKETQLIGGSAFDEATGKYKALLIAIDPQKTWKNDEKADYNTFLKMITPAGNLAFVVDKESGLIAYSNLEAARDIYAGNVGLYSVDAPDTELDYYRITTDQYTERYYGAYLSDEDYQYYYMIFDDVITKSTMPYALSCGIGFILIHWIVTAFMLHHYKPDAYNQTVMVTKPSGEHTPMEESLITEWVRYRNAPEDQEDLKSFWKRLSPELKATTFIQAVFGLFLIAGIYLLFSPATTRVRSSIEFILRGNWRRGVHLISFSAILILIISFTIFVMLKDLLLNLVSSTLEAKAKTIMRLIFSLIQYAAIIALLFLSFEFLGFDTRALLASVSIMSLAVTLGAKDLVADILAGIFIIFEDDFRVGDIIEVNGFSGIVEEIGVRSTKLIGIGDNIKIIGNESVKNVLNMSKMNSWYSIDLKVPADQPIAEIEEMLRQELPAIGESIPEIISGPYYKGVMVLSGTHTLYIIAECRQENYRRVQRALNHAILELFNRHGYRFGGF